MPSNDLRPPATIEASSRRALWVGEARDVELAIAGRRLAERMAVVEAPDARSAGAIWDAAIAADGLPTGTTPTLVLLATDRPGRWQLDDTICLGRRWPLAPIVSLLTSLGDGRRRSGPPLSGVEDVVWHDLPGRLEHWLGEIDAGRPGPLGLPSTARREERLLEGGFARPARSDGGLAVSLVAAREGDLEPLVDLLRLTGRRVVSRSCGRPRFDEPAPVLVWDLVSLDGDALDWLRMLIANRPGLAVVLLESFPRGDSTEAALRAGARAVLGRPVSLESLAGTLAGLDAAPMRPAFALGRRSEAR
jgi:hypothetical protein